MIQLMSKKSATKFLCMKTSSNRVVATSFLYPMVHRRIVGNVPIYLKFALKVTHPFRKHWFWHISLNSAAAVRASEKSSIIANRKLTARFPSSHRWTLFVTAESPTGWLKKRLFTFRSFHFSCIGPLRTCIIYGTITSFVLFSPSKSRIGLLIWWKWYLSEMHSGKIIFVAICSGYPLYIGYFDKTKGNGKRYIVCLSSSSWDRDTKFCHFSRWRSEAILGLAIRKVLNLKNNHARVFVMPMLVRNDTLFVFLAYLGL